jgi:hypothetical protein
VLEPLRLKHITKGMRLAAQSGGMYHLWWHPHNFGVDMQANLAFLEEVLRCYSALAAEYGMRSCTMEETAHVIRSEVGGRSPAGDEEKIRLPHYTHRPA